MEVNHFDVYAQFLLECKKAMGTVDFERLDSDSEYRTEVCQRITLNADDTLFEIANLVNQEIDEEALNQH